MEYVNMLEKHERCNKMVKEEKCSLKLQNLKNVHIHVK